MRRFNPQEGGPGTAFLGVYSIVRRMPLSTRTYLKIEGRSRSAIKGG